MNERPVIYQLLAGFRAGDAISNEATLISQICTQHGYKAPIFAPLPNIGPESRSLAGDVEKLPALVKPGDIALLHLSIGSRCNDIFPNLPCRKVVLYHNVTPPKFFERLNPALAQVLADGLDAVKKLSTVDADIWADSAFNAAELRQMGYRDPKVLPLIIDDKFGTGRVAPFTRDRLTNPPLTNILFVGRLAPNKRHDALLRVFAAYQRNVNPASRLVIVGGTGGAEIYKTLLLGDVYVYALKNVVFLDFVEDADLQACYATADAFLCMSDHEGFCAPLLEAMAWHVPVFANAAGAVPETLDGAGVLFDHVDPREIAETMGRVLSDPELKAAVVKKQDERLARFRARDVWAEISTMLGIA